ncbi:MAG: nucleotide exchange factor GrpE [Thermoleophilaceae bacterium]|nr:nucleotide exchange factor GrpE [Thermoleophilaceae bacterium]
MAERRNKPDESVVREQLRQEQRLVSGDDARDDQSPAAPEDPVQTDPTEPAGEQDPENEAERIPEEEEAGDGGQEAADGEPEAEADGEPEDELTAARRERDEYLAAAQRTQADFENYRKRAAKESASAGDRARSNLVRELLPAIDNLERALSSADDREQGLADGVQLVYSELLAVLQRSGVEAFDPAGEPFDPEFHEALSTRPEEGAQPGVVLDVIEKGYRLNGSVLRPARVVVSG